MDINRQLVYWIPHKRQSICVTRSRTLAEKSGAISHQIVRQDLCPCEDRIHSLGGNIPKSTYTTASDKQAQRLPPKSILTWFWETISCLWKHLNLISLHMTHPGSVCGIISVTQPGCVAYWQVLSARGQAGPSAAQKWGLPGQRFPSWIRYIL